MTSAEFEMIAELTDGLTFGSDVRLGPGDDAIVLVPHGDIAITTNVLTENVHFKRAWSSAFQTGRRAVAVSVPDIETIGAEPSAVVIGLAFPRNLDRRWVNDFQEDAAEECARAGVDLVGSSLSSSARIALGVTALGNLSGRPAATRAGARADNQVAVCGRLSCSAGGLLILRRGFSSPKDLVLEQQYPTIPYEQGKVAAKAGATAMIDVSDGLLQDLGHICELSGVDIGVRTGTLKIHDSLTRLAAATGRDPLGFVLAGGEDHTLAATFLAEVELPQSWLRIDAVTAGVEVTVNDIPWTDSVGWDHFA